MDDRVESALVDWLSSTENPPVRYLTARDVMHPRPPAESLTAMRSAITTWEPLAQILALQRSDGSFAAKGDPADARRTFWALLLMHRCGLDATDEPVCRAMDHLFEHHRASGAVSYTKGGSGVLPCYLGVVTTALVKMGALETDLVQSAIRWLVEHQRFDYGGSRAGGSESWPFKAPGNYGCWESVSCYHGVAGAFRALSAIPPNRRSAPVVERLEEALDYLRAHHLYKRSQGDRPLFRHMTQPFIIGGYRSDLLDMLQGIADADPTLIRENWVQAAVDDMEALTVDGEVPLVRNYGRKLIDPIPFEAVGEPSRFLTYQWILIQRSFDTAA